MDNSGTGAAHFFDDATIERIQQYMRGEITTTADPSLSQAGNCFVFNQRSNDNQNWPRNFITTTRTGRAISLTRRLSDTNTT